MRTPEIVRDFLSKNPQCPVLIMGNTSWDYEIIALDDGLSGQDWRPHSGRPVVCLGALGIIEGVGKSALVAPLEEQAVRFIVGMYAEHVKQRTSAQEAEDGPCVIEFDTTPGTSDVAWLEALHALPDPRPYPHTS